MSSEVKFNEGIRDIIRVCELFRRVEIEPMALELDEGYNHERVQAFLRKCAEPGIPSLLVPEEFGGVGQDYLTVALILDELAYGCAGLATLFAYHFAACRPLLDEAVGGRRGEYLEALSGEADGLPVLATLAFPGVEDRDDEPRIEDAGGEPVLAGRAVLVGGAPLASYLVLFAREADRGGLSLAVVDLDSPDVSISEPQKLLGLYTLPFADVTFERCVLPEGSILGARGDAETALGQALHCFNGIVAAVSMGASRSAYDKAFEYARERWQFGKYIVEHQQIQRYLANMLVKINMGTAGFTQAFSGEELGSLATAGRGDFAKVFCTNAAMEIVFDAIQVHGAIGYMKETGLEKIMRDVKMLQVLGKANPFLEVEAVEALL